MIDAAKILKAAQRPNVR